MEIEKIKDSQFPEGRGARLKSSQEFWNLLAEVKTMKLGDQPLKVSSVGKSKTSANSLRTLLEDQLKNLADKYVLTCAANGDGFYALYIKRVRQ